MRGLKRFCRVLVLIGKATIAPYVELRPHSGEDERFICIVSQ